MKLKKLFILLLFLACNYFMFSQQNNMNKKNKKFFIISKEDSSVSKIDISPNGKYLVSGSKQGIVLRDAETFEILNVFSESNREINTLKFSPDSSSFLTILDGKTIILWNTENYSEILRLNLKTNTPVLDAAYSNDNLSIIIPLDGKTIDICFMLLMTKKITSKPLIKTSGSIYSINAYKNLLLSTCADGTVNLTNINTNENLETFFCYTNTHIPAVLSPDGKSFVCAEKNNILVARNLTGDILFKINDSEIPTNKLAFSKDGKLLATTIKNGDLKIYNYKNGLLKHCIKTSDFNKKTNDYINDFAFSPDEKYVYLCSKYGNLIQWKLSDNPEDDSKKPEQKKKKQKNIDSKPTEDETETRIESPQNNDAENQNNQESNKPANKSINPSSTLFFGAGYTMIPTEYYIGNFDFDICFQKNLKKIPLTFGIDLNLEGAVPSKTYPYKYTYLDGTETKQPWMYTIKPLFNIGYELYNKKSRVFFNIFSGPTFRFLWNNNLKKCIITDIYKNIDAGITGGVDFNGLTFKFSLIYDTQLGFQPAGQIGYTIKFYPKKGIK